MNAFVRNILEGIQRARRFATRDIWQIGTPGEQLPRGFIIKQLRVAILLGSKLLDGQHMIRAAALTFATLLSIVPLLAVVFFLISRLHLDTQIYELIASRIENVADRVAGGDADNAAAPPSLIAEPVVPAPVTEPAPVEPVESVPPTADTPPPPQDVAPAPPTEPISPERRDELQQEIIRTMFQGVTSNRNGMKDPVEGISKTAENLAKLASDAASNSAALTISGIVFVLSTVFGLMRNIENTFNNIWGVRRGRSWYRTMSDYLIIMLLLPFVVTAVMGVLAALQSDSVVRAMGPFRLGLGLGQYVLVVLVFTLMYRFVPNTTVQFRNAVIAGFVAGTLWVGLSWGYVKFQFGIANYALVLSAFAQFPMLLMWIYLSWAILLLGCEVAYAYQHERTFALERYASGASYAYREAVGLRAMIEIGRRFAAGGPGFSAPTASQQWNVPLRLLDCELDALVAAGLLAVRAGDPEEYLPARPLDRISASEIIRVLREDGTKPSRFLEDSRYSKLYAELARTDTAFAGATLEDLVASEDPDAVTIPSANA